MATDDRTDEATRLLAAIIQHTRGSKRLTAPKLAETIHELVTMASTPAVVPVAEGNGLPPRIGHILRLAEIIREVDGNHDKGAAALAEAILSHPCCGTPAPAPVAEGGLSDEELLKMAAKALGCKYSIDWFLTGHPGLKAYPRDLTTFARSLLARAALAAEPDPAPVPVADVRYEFSVYNDDDEEQAGGDAATLEHARREGGHYLAQYNQDGPHRLELRRVEIIPIPAAQQAT